MAIIDVIIPVLNEEASIGKVLDDISKDLVREIVVVDNGSTDNTKVVAQKHGATVLQEPRKGYGSACLKGLDHLNQKSVEPDIVVFIDGDYSDNPKEMQQVVQPILDGIAEACIGSRTTGQSEKGAMLPHQRFGNWLAAVLIRIIYGLRITDLGPFRAITWRALKQIQMQDKDFGWTVELQAKVAKAKIGYAEVPVSYKQRIGVSKVSGSMKASVQAGVKILWTIFRLA